MNVKERKETILYLGSNGFPFGLAQIQRQIQISKSILRGNKNILVINRYGVNHKDSTNDLKFSGSFEGIGYIYTSFAPYYPSNFLTRNFLKILGIINEFIILVYFSLFTSTKTVLVNTTNLRQLKYYRFVCTLLRLNVIYDYVEYIYSISKRDLKQIPENITTFDNSFTKYCDKVIVISKFLEKVVTDLDKNKRILLIPPIINFDYFTTSAPVATNHYFLFCGSAGYFDVVKFIITAYEKSISTKHDYKLILVVNGTAEQMKKVNELIYSLNLSDSIIILSNLKYEHLISYYNSSKALLIPLQDNLQDRARFPFKISEYTASKRPIISTDFGSAADFFRDGENALLAKLNDVNNFSEKLNFVINNPADADKIGLAGFKLGEELFNYERYTDRLISLIEEKE